MYRLFIDEVGHSNLGSSDHPNERYLSLTGIIFDLREHDLEFTPELTNLKTRFFGSGDVILHRRELAYRKPPFEALRDSEVRNQFGRDLFTLIAKSRFRAITVVIDKQEHKERYKV